jgi:endonuclease G, mitochondrial
MVHAEPFPLPMILRLPSFAFLLLLLQYLPGITAAQQAKSPASFPAAERVSRISTGTPERTLPFEIPKTAPADRVIMHTGYAFVFSPVYMQSRWVAWELTREETISLYPRSDDFRPDPAVSSGTATDADYEGSGYDRGHLAPAADMGWSARAMDESFYYSNMSPQTPSFNRGIWKKLEEQVRSWAITYGSVYVVTGPVLKPGLSSIGPHGVAVPELYYKVILRTLEPDETGIAFVMRNSASKLPLTTFAVTIDSVEKLTGIDFFPTLSKEEEHLAEAILCLNCWNWSSSTAKKPVAKNGTVSVPCRGITKAGLPCQNHTTSLTGYCYLHESQDKGGVLTPASGENTNRRTVSVQCSGTTKAGNRCKHRTYSANGRCFQHGGN